MIARPLRSRSSFRRPRNQPTGAETTPRAADLLSYFSQLAALAFGLEDCANLVDAGHGDDFVVLAAGAGRLFEPCPDLRLLVARDRRLRDLALHIFEFARTFLLLRIRCAAEPGEQSNSQSKLPHEHGLRFPSHHRRTPELRLQFLDGGVIKISGRSGQPDTGHNADPQIASLLSV